MIIRAAARPERNFYILDKTISEDPRLSWAARGLLIFLLGKPNHWRVSQRALVQETATSARHAGREAVAGLLNELIACGYCTRSQPRLLNGTVGPIQYVVSEVCEFSAPQAAPPDAATQPLSANPDAAPLSAWPLAAKQALVSIDRKARTEEDQYPKANTEKKKENAGAPVRRLGFDFEHGHFTDLSELLRAKWHSSYPLVNVNAEIGRASVWLVSNPAHAKKDYARFVNGWLARAQDRAAGQQAHQTTRQGAQTAGDRGCPSTRPMSRAERAQAAGMAMMGLTPDDYLPGAPLPSWMGGQADNQDGPDSHDGHTIDAASRLVPDRPDMPDMGDGGTL